jgi:aminopeptidase-like protein
VAIGFQKDLQCRFVVPLRVTGKYSWTEEREHLDHSRMSLISLCLKTPNCNLYPNSKMWEDVINKTVLKILKRYNVSVF